MSLGQAKAISLLGLHGSVVTVEVHITTGLPAFSLIGLPDAALNEARDRVRAALASCGFSFPARRVTVNLAPAALPKSGSGFDLSIAMALLHAAGLLSSPPQLNTVFLGELGLDGSVHPVRGALPVVLAAREAGVETVVLSEGNAAEAKLIPGIQIIAADHLTSVARRFGAEIDIDPEQRTTAIYAVSDSKEKPAQLDLKDVIGQPTAKFALEVAAAGGHNLFMVGPPGTGKSMLAARLPSILPLLHVNQALQVASVKSLSGTLSASGSLDLVPPFESPHHTATSAALVGGGSGMIRPGAISRAHCGVLFLDETPEFSTRVLQTLRQPMEHGVVSISRVSGTATYPAKFQLVAAANPCPCGNAYGTGMKCMCTSIQQRRYMQRLSGPLLDRIDLQVDVLPIHSAATDITGNEDSETVRARVVAAREMAVERMKHMNWLSNSEATGTWIRARLGSGSSVISELNRMVDSGVLTMRGADRVLRVAWTLADLQGQDVPTNSELVQAVALRTRVGTQ